MNTDARCPSALISVLVTGLAGSTMQAVGAADEPTFARDIAPIIFTHCAPCHRSGQSGPFPLLNYEDVQKRGRQIAQVTQSRFMPPWLPEPSAHGVQFMGSRRLADEQIEAIRRWVESGMPRGDDADLPPRPTFHDGWQLGEPDMVLAVEEPFTVPAEGNDVIQTFVLPVNMPADRWVKAIEFRPGNPQLVHHASFLIDTTGGARMMDNADPKPGYPGMGNIGLNQVGSFGGWTPGAAMQPLGPGMGRRLPASCDLVVEVHFNPIGKPEIEQPAIGLHFADEPITHPVMSVTLGAFLLDIPAGEARHIVKDAFTIPVAVDVLAIRPHAHYLCQRMTITATPQDGSPAIVLLQVNDWDFNWQQVWQLTSPRALPAQTRLEMEFVYDNSAANPQNPFHPPRAVRDGHNTTDEMAQVFLHVSPRDPADLAALEAAYQRKLLERMRHDQARRIEAQRARQSETRPTTPANASPRPER